MLILIIFCRGCGIFLARWKVLPYARRWVVYSMPKAVYRKMLRSEWLKKKKLVFMKRFLLYVLFKGVYGGVCRVETGAFGAHFTPSGADSAERKGI